MSDQVQQLKDLQPTREFFIGIDSDGCVFDSMEIKHKECFTPMFIKHFNLQAASKYAREVWEFVNLYSKSRGINRFPALSNSLNLLAERREVHTRQVAIAATDSLDEWLSRERKLSNAALQAEIERGNDALQPVMAWSNAVNAMIEDIVKGVPPFPFVRETLAKMNERADPLVVSQTPTAALEREWAEHDLAAEVRMIVGQEAGTKTDHIRLAAAGKYQPAKILMIGDAPGDFKAAKANGALFYPILPGVEEESWQRLYEEALDVFFSGDYSGDYEAALVQQFNASLPEKPNWT
jgi:phosphoglycolate phosphatase-like HAD superfamily hydrolase